jgi:hypothetical protein
MLPLKSKVEVFLFFQEYKYKFHSVGVLNKDPFLLKKILANPYLQIQGWHLGCVRSM